MMKSWEDEARQALGIVAATVADLDSSATVKVVSSRGFETDTYEFLISLRGSVALTVVTWEAAVSALNNPEYRQGEFQEAFRQILLDLTAAGAPRYNYMVTTRGLRRQPLDVTGERLKDYANLEEADRVAEEFFARRRGA